MTRVNEVSTSTNRREITKGLVKSVVSIPLVIGALVVIAPAAWAHTGTASISCTGVTYSFSDFPNASGNTVHETVLVDSAKVASENFTFDGPSASNTVSISVGSGTHSVVAKARWDTNGVSGSFQVTKQLSGCGAPTCPSNAISSNFNGTSIPAGDFIWFNAVVKASGVAQNGGSVIYRDAGVTFTADGVSYDIPIPAARLTYSSTATTGSTTFKGHKWVTQSPASFGDSVFLSGAAYQVPAGGLPGGISPVTWTGDFTLSGISSVSWQWAAAVYSQFSSNLNSLGVKPLHSTSLDKYPNGDQAGTPENFKTYAVGGATGGGAGNATGSYSGTGHCP